MVGNSVVNISLSGGQNALVASVREANSSSIVLSGVNLLGEPIAVVL